MSFHEKVAGIRDRVLKMPEYSEPINLLETRIREGQLGRDENIINREESGIEI